MTDDERFVNAITALSESFRQKASPGMFRGYRLGLAGVPIEQIEKAAAAALQRCKFMPVPSELRELAGADGMSYDAMAERAFHVLLRTIQQTGPDYSVNFADGAINATVRLLGGWQRACELPVEEFDKWYRRDFLATYVRLCRDGASEDLRRYHGGRLERDNAVWDGKQIEASGTVYSLEKFGGGVQQIGVEYTPALAAPEPKRAIGVARESFVELKLLGREDQ